MSSRRGPCDTSEAVPLVEDKRHLDPIERAFNMYWQARLQKDVGIRARLILGGEHRPHGCRARLGRRRRRDGHRSRAQAGDRPRRSASRSPRRKLDRHPQADRGAPTPVSHCASPGPGRHLVVQAHDGPGARHGSADGDPSIGSRHPAKTPEPTPSTLGLSAIWIGCPSTPLTQEPLRPACHADLGPRRRRQGGEQEDKKKTKR